MYDNKEIYENIKGNLDFKGGGVEGRPPGATEAPSLAPKTGDLSPISNKELTNKEVHINNL